MPPGDIPTLFGLGTMRFRMETSSLNVAGPHMYHTHSSLIAPPTTDTHLDSVSTWVLLIRFLGVPSSLDRYGSQLLNSMCFEAFGPPGSLLWSSGKVRA